MQDKNERIKKNLNLKLKNKKQDEKMWEGKIQSNENQQQIAYEGQKEEELREVLNSLLPEIEKELMKDIQRELQTEFEEKFLKTVDQIEAQAQEEYQLAVKQLEESQQLLQHQKQTQINNQIKALQSQLENITQQHLLKLQEKFLQENFDSQIMTHYKIVDLQKLIQEEIFTLLQEKHEITKQRQLKELIIANQTKEIKLRKELDGQIKSRIFFSSGLQELKQQIKQSRTQMGSQKSDYNLRLKRIQGEIRQYEEKIREINKMGSLQELENEHQRLKIELLQMESQNKLNTNNKNRTKLGNEIGNKQELIKGTGNYQDDEEEMSDIESDSESDSLDSYTEQGQRNQYHHGNNNNNNRSKSKSFLKSEYHNERSQSNNMFKKQNIKDSLNQQSNPNTYKKFDLTAYFQNYLHQNQSHPTTHNQLQYNQNQYNLQQQNNQSKSLLNLQNISQILKQKITHDPLEKYLHTQKQNLNSNNTNPNKQSKSNFQQLYQQHLKNLNKAPPKKSFKASDSTGLSLKAKKTIIKNLAQHHKNNFEYKNLQNNNIIPTQNDEESENQNTYETYLLGGNF